MKAKIFQFSPGNDAQIEFQLNELLSPFNRENIVQILQTTGTYTVITVMYEETNEFKGSELVELLKRNVNILKLSNFARNRLINAGITTLAQLCSKTEWEMLKYRALGKKSLSEMKEELSALGLHFGMIVPPEAF